MSKKFDEIISILLSQLLKIADIDTRQLSRLYLGSSYKKLLFAKRRLKSLRSRIAYLSRGYMVELPGGDLQLKFPQKTLSIEMDFDHCIVSLRSSLEHLAQLVNVTLSLGLKPRGKNREAVSFNAVINAIEGNHKLKSVEYLKELASNLKREKEDNWFKELNTLRTESMHITSGTLPKTELFIIRNEIIGLHFLLPRGQVNSITTEEDRDILNYCRNRIRDVQRTLKISFHTLSKYMSNRMG